MHMRACMYACVYIWVCVYMLACACVYVYVYVCTCHKLQNREKIFIVEIWWERNTKLQTNLKYYQNLER